jgi:mannose-6-phosphate isomerase class I
VRYDAHPTYPVSGAEPALGYDVPSAELVGRRPCVVALDGHPAVAWDRVSADLLAAVRAAGATAKAIDVRSSFAPWSELRRRTAETELPGDPVFARIYTGALRSFFDEFPRVTRDVDVLLVFGPGSALVEHDILWYAGFPKHLSLTELVNLGPPRAEGSEQRLLFVDWPVLDRHAQELSGRIDRYVDLSDADAPRSLDGESLRRSLRDLAQRPFRTRPTFLPGPWGGQWLRRELGVATNARNLAWSYELITPESGILIGLENTVEVGFELLMAEQAAQVLGPSVASRFGLSFPIRFDYLDTLDGGNLSIQCHPSEQYMQSTFGLPYTQHETYYVMVTTPGAGVFLGLRDDADLDAFRAAAESGDAFEPTQFLQLQRAEQHRLYLIPAGTPHASGAGNVVLEISATPYLYTLRFYDWLRRDLDGSLRPVHLEHAFANLDPRRAGAAVRELMPEPTVARSGQGWAELELGRHPDLFFGVNRFDFEESVDDDTDGRFHVLNLVDGAEISIEWARGTASLAYAETIVVPAAVGPYRLHTVGGGSCKVVKAFVL